MGLWKEEACFRAWSVWSAWRIAPCLIGATCSSHWWCRLVRLKRVWRCRATRSVSYGCHRD